MIGITEDLATGTWDAPAPPAYARSRWLFLRLVGLVYLTAFLSLGVQVSGLVGPHGILPAGAFLDQAHATYGSAAYRLIPTLCWFGAGDGMLRALCWGEAVRSVARPQRARLPLLHPAGASLDRLVCAAGAPVAASRDDARDPGDRAPRALAPLRAGAVASRALRRVRPAGPEPAWHRPHRQLRVLQPARAGAVRLAPRRPRARARAAARGGAAGAPGAPAAVGGVRDPGRRAALPAPLPARLRARDRTDDPGHARHVRQPVAPRRRRAGRGERLRPVPRDDHGASRDRHRGQRRQRALARVRVPLEAGPSGPPARGRRPPHAQALP